MVEVVLGAGSSGNPPVGGPVQVGGSDGTNLRALKTATDGTLAVQVASLPLPSGAATAALQPALNANGGALAHVLNFPAIQAATQVDRQGAAVDAMRHAPRGRVLIPFRPDSIIDASVGGTITFRAADERTSALIDGNDDQSHSLIYASITASGTWANYGRVIFGFYGRLLGLRWRHQSSGDSVDYWQKPFCVAVDGVYRSVDLTPIYEVPYYTRTLAQRSRTNILFADLGPGWHQAAIHIPCDSAATRVMAFDGLIVEDGAGNPTGPIAEIIAPMQPVALSAGAWTQVNPRVSSQGAPTLFGLKAVYIRNTNASGGAPVTVSARLYTASGAGTYPAFWSATIAPQQTEVLRMSDGGNNSATVQSIELQADVSGAQFIIAGVR